MKHIYLTYVDSCIGAFKPDDKAIHYAKSDKFVDFVIKLKKKYPDYRFRCVINWGIEELIRKRIKIDKILAKTLEKNRD